MGGEDCSSGVTSSSEGPLWFGLQIHDLCYCLAACHHLLKMLWFDGSRKKEMENQREQNDILNNLEQRRIQTKSKWISSSPWWSRQPSHVALHRHGRPVWPSHDWPCKFKPWTCLRQQPPVPRNVGSLGGGGGRWVVVAGEVADSWMAAASAAEDANRVREAKNACIQNNN